MLSPVKNISSTNVIIPCFTASFFNGVGETIFNIVNMLFQKATNDFPRRVMNAINAHSLALLFEKLAALYASLPQTADKFRKISDPLIEQSGEISGDVWGYRLSIITVTPARYCWYFFQDRHNQEWGVCILGEDCFWITGTITSYRINKSSKRDSLTLEELSELLVTDVKELIFNRLKLLSSE